MDMGTVVMLFNYIHEWGSLSAGDFFSGIQDFRQDVGDCIVALAIRLLLVPALIATACHVGKPILETQVTESMLNSERTPLLLSVQEEEHEATSLLPNGGLKRDRRDDSNPFAATNSREKIAYQLNKRTELKTTIILVIIFLINTSIQAFVGVKCVSFSFGRLSEGIAGSLLGIQVLYLMLESALSQWIVTAATKTSGHLIKQFHVHPLHYIDKLPGHYCDLCRSRMRRGYRCKMCDFDVCVSCFTSKDKSRGEGVLRGDKGVKEEKEITNTIFMKRAFALCRPQIHLFVVAFLCLIANSLAALLLPNYQGEILDRVVDHDSPGFMRSVLLYLGLSVATGLFGAIKNLAFNVVGRRMSAAVREKLFSAIIVQDIAFFDGVHSGDLTSRLSNDISAMVAPAQSMLGSLLQNFLSLIGGIVMCFLTSWRLSMLAFTMVAPIVYCTDVYAKWSRKLNSQIYAALGDAMQVFIFR